MTVLHTYALELKLKIHSIYENKENRSTDVISDFVKRASQSHPEQVKRLLKNRNTARMLENNFFREATQTRDSFDPHALEDKEELAYVALLSLVLIVVVMLTDVVEIVPVDSRALFVNLLIGVGCVYSGLLYRNFFMSKKKGRENGGMVVDRDRFEKPRRSAMMVGMFVSFFLWVAACLFINSPIVACLSFPFILAGGIWMTKRRWIDICDKYQKYDRTFILKHCVYLVLFTLVCAVLVDRLAAIDCFSAGWRDSVYAEKRRDWQAAVGLMRDPVVARYVALAFFTLNTFVFPLFAGYLYLKLKERRAIRQINDIFSRYEEKVSEYASDFKTIVRELESDGSE